MTNICMGIFHQCSTQNMLRCRQCDYTIFLKIFHFEVICTYQIMPRVIEVWACNVITPKCKPLQKYPLYTFKLSDCLIIHNIVLLRVQYSNDSTVHRIAKCRLASSEKWCNEYSVTFIVLYWHKKVYSAHAY